MRKKERTRKNVKRLLSLICALTLTLSFASCSKTAGNVQENASNNAGMAENAYSGSPWVNSCLKENLPETAPDAKDDLYLHYDRDLLEEHAGSFYLTASARQGTVAGYVKQVIEGKAGQGLANGGYSQAELDQLRIFYSQAQDLDALKEAGITLIRPYLDSIAAAESLKELEKVLLSDDFPFSPYIYFTVSAYDMSGKNNVFIYPELLFVDNLAGPEYYQETTDPSELTANLNMIYQEGAYVMQDLTWLGMDYEQIQTKMDELIGIEASYAKDAGCSERYLDQPFGAFGASTENFSLDELAALCPNFPIKETAAKFGKDASGYFSVWEKGWLTSFSAVWIEENLELLKLLTQAKILHECEPFLDPAVYDSVRQVMGEEAMSAEANALAVSRRPFVFGQLYSKIFTADQYTPGEISRLYDIADSLVASCRKMVGETEWISAGSKAKMIEKLDRMRMCIMQPDGGYLDYSDLGLVSSEEGGSLLGNYLKIKAWYNEQDNLLLKKDAAAQFFWNYSDLGYGNCTYESDTNSVLISPGFLDSIGYSAEMKDEELYATFGWILAHEISHAFDFTGAQCDAYGRGISILDDSDIRNYVAVTEKLQAYLDTIEVLPGINLSGIRVGTEVSADITGMQIVMEAAKNIKGFDFEKFFEHFAKYLFMSLPSAEYAEFLSTDEHPLHFIRANVTAQMADEFYDTYGASEGDHMYLPKDQRIKFWGK